MVALKKLSAAQLNKIVDETQAELTRRKNIDAATSEIRSILKKYKIGFQDIDLNITTKTGGRRSTKKHAKVIKSRDQRSTVKAKYKDPNSAATLARRGRPPAWFRVFCRMKASILKGSKKITVAAKF